jgi:hypothetical protein
VVLGLVALVFVVLELQDMDRTVSRSHSASSGEDEACSFLNYSLGTLGHNWDLLLPREKLG